MVLYYIGKRCRGELINDQEYDESILFDLWGELDSDDDYRRHKGYINEVSVGAVSIAELIRLLLLLGVVKDDELRLFSNSLFASKRICRRKCKG